MRRKLPEDRIVINSYQEGNSTYKIAKEFSCHWTAVRHLLRKNKIKLRKNGFKIGEVLWEKEKHPNWKGGTYINAQGYKLIMCKEHPFANNLGYVREHRLVMEKNLGRMLLPSEIIHHINGGKLDNRIENLMLFKSSNDHNKYHSLLKKEGLL